MSPPMSGLVDFFVVGAQKAGTTALSHFLGRHPELQMSSVKEPHFFDDETVDWGSPDYMRLHAHFDWFVPGTLRGEATPIYSYWPPALARLSTYNPSAKVVMALRQPALRAYSHWRMEVSRNIETLSFDEAIADAGRQRVRQSPLGAHRVFSYVERGFYAGQVERALSLFSPEQIHFLRTDELWSQTATVLWDVEDFLGVDRAPRGDTHDYLVSVMAAHVGTMTHEAQARLTDHYADDIRRTAELTELDLDDWLDADYREPMTPPST